MSSQTIRFAKAERLKINGLECMQGFQGRPF